MIFLIDFDKTISMQCSCTTMIEGFKISSTDEIDDQWQRGILSTPDATVQLLKILQMTEEELITLMKTVEIDPSFIDFIQYCKQNEHEYAIVSDGFSILIDTILHTQIYNQNKVHFPEPIPIYANELVYCDPNWTTNFPHYSDETPNLGVSKSKIVKHYQQTSPVTFIGDGITDYQAAEVADVVFAKDKLAVYCREHSIPYIPYASFQDIIDYLKK